MALRSGFLVPIDRLAITVRHAATVKIEITKRKLGITVPAEAAGQQEPFRRPVVVLAGLQPVGVKITGRILRTNMALVSGLAVPFQRRFVIAKCRVGVTIDMA